MVDQEKQKINLIWQCVLIIKNVILNGNKNEKICQIIWIFSDMVKQE